MIREDMKMNTIREQGEEQGDDPFCSVGTRL